MAIKAKKGKDITEIHYVDTIEGGLIVRKVVFAVYKAGKLLWELITSNFFSKDNKIIVSKDGYAFNGKESN